MDKTVHVTLLFSYSNVPDEDTIRRRIEQVLDCDVTDYDEEDD